MIVFCDYLMLTFANSHSHQLTSNNRRNLARGTGGRHTQPRCARGWQKLIFTLNWTNSPLKSFCHLAPIDNGSKQNSQRQTQTLGRKHTPAAPPTHLTRVGGGKKKIFNNGKLKTLHCQTLSSKIPVTCG